MRFKGSFIDLGVRVCIFNLRWVYGDCVRDYLFCGCVGWSGRKGKEKTLLI